MVANILNGSFTNITDFVKKFLVNHLLKAKQDTFATRYQDLVVGTGGAEKNRTQIITVMTNKVTTAAGLVELLEEEKQIRQIHLVVQTQNADKPAYDTETSSEDDRKPSKSSLGSKKPSATTRGRQHKKIKTEVKTEVKTKENKATHKSVKVC